jgi:hypothetical protein
VLGVSASFLHEFNVRGEWATAQKRLRTWSAEQAFTNPDSGQIEATPSFVAAQGWSVAVWLPKGRRTFISLTVEGLLLPSLAQHLPEYDLVQQDKSCGRELTLDERRRAFDNWMPRFSESTRAAWDETVDPVMFNHTGWVLRVEHMSLDHPVNSFVDILLKDEQTAPHVGVANAMVSHSWENSFSHLDSAIQSYVKRKHLNPKNFFVWLDGFCIDKTTECDATFLRDTFSAVIISCGTMLSVLEPYENPFPLHRCWCVYEMYIAIKCLPASEWEAILSAEETHRIESDVWRPNALSTILDNIEQVDVNRARAFHAEEASMIKQIIADFDGDGIISGVEYVNGQVRALLARWHEPYINTRESLTMYHPRPAAPTREVVNAIANPVAVDIAAPAATAVRGPGPRQRSNSLAILGPHEPRGAITPVSMTGPTRQGRSCYHAAPCFASYRESICRVAAHVSVK